MEYQDNRETYAKIATLYYLSDLSQDQIAHMFGISRFKVSRVLKKCKEYSIVEFKINNSTAYQKRLEEQICQLLSLDRVIVVNSGTTDYESKINVGKAAAAYLTDHLKDGMSVGFDWGTTLQTMIREFNPAKKYTNALFLQISGSVSSQTLTGTSYIVDGHDIVRSLAMKASAGWSLFPAPYIFKDSHLRSLLLEDPAIKSHIDHFHNVDMVFFGIGSSQSDERDLFYKNYLTKEEFALLLPDDEHGELLSNTFDLQGNISPHSLLAHRTLTIGFDVLKAVPIKIALASGNKKANSLIAGARGGYISVMIVDEVAALSILNRLCNT